VPATAQFIYQVHDLDKPEMIARILQSENSGITIVFTRTKRQAQRVADDLAERGFPSSPLHGDMPQVAREKALAKFRAGKLKVLVATDVAARGIDVADVTHVINYSCPEDEKTYVHRIGRTGRAGATGIAITLVDWADVTRWKVINKMLDLPFDDPPETYSTSEHFYHEQGIAPGTKGRIVPETPVEKPARESKPRSERGAGEDRPRRNRSRTRTRSGETVSEGSAGGSASKPESAESDTGSAPRSRNRRRRRTRSGETAQASKD
jgi:superfamily II DNA/RNA helicase